MTINAEVKPFPYESIERLLKRFTKKCKKEEIIREYCDKSRYKNKRQRRKEKALRAHRIAQKYSKQ